MDEGQSPEDHQRGAEQVSTVAPALVAMATLLNAACFLSEALGEILVVVKSLGMGFHLPVDGIRSLALVGDEEEEEEEEHEVILAPPIC